jgi:imidazolonepropionase-like amidohydrolase
MGHAGSNKGRGALSRRRALGAVGASVAALAAGRTFAATQAPGKPVLFTNLRLFDGLTPRLQAGRSVLVQDGLIAAVIGDGERPEGAQIVDCGGRTLMPGLIDAHWHSMLCAMSMTDLMTADIGLINLVAAHEAERTLMRGFTSVRDLAGPSFSLKRAIDTGLATGPRIWPSGAMISQSGGHGDFRMPYEVPSATNAPLSRGEAVGAGVIADGPEEVMKRSREQLMLGASQLKLAAGGGVASTYDPIDVTQYTQAEFRAAVDCAENWGTYVTVHAYTPRAMQTAIRGGVRCIDHGQMMDEETAKMIAGEGIWFSSQAFIAGPYANQYPEGSANQAKQRVMFAGTDKAYELAKKYRLKTAWGTDMLFDPAMTKNQGAILAQMTRWYPSDEVLMMATARNAELLAMSGERNPYPGKVGVVERGAHADLLVVEGDPLGNVSLIADPDANLRVIMKAGRIYKNSISA